MINFHIVEIIVNVYIPILLLFVPGLMLYYHLKSNEIIILIEKSLAIKFLLVMLLFTLGIFVVLLFLSGDFGRYYFVENGAYFFPNGLIINFMSKYSIAIFTNIGFTIFTVSFLSALLYSSLLVLPKNCSIFYQIQGEVQPKKVIQPVNSKTMTLGSGAIASVSSVATTTLC
jgi:hypothetical protein